MEIPGMRLIALQSTLAEIAAKYEFNLLSPFADRHGFPEARFVRSMGGISKFISVALDSAVPDRWRCEMRAGAAEPPVSAFAEPNTHSRLLNDLYFNPSAPGAEIHDMLAGLFKRAVAVAHTSYEIVRSRSDESVPSGDKEAKRLTSVGTAPLKTRVTV